MKRLSGIIILGGIGLIWCIVSFVHSLFVDQVNISIAISSIIIISIYICLLARINWARIFFLAIYGIVLVLAYFITIMTLLVQTFADVVINILERLPTTLDKMYYFFALCYPIVFVYYFTRSNVKKQFTTKVSTRSQSSGFPQRRVIKDKRLRTVSILSLIAIIFGVCGLLYDLLCHFVIIRTPDIYGYIYQPVNMMFERIVLLAFRVGIIYPLFIISGILVLRLKEWGRKLLIFISWISLINISLFPYYVWPNIFSSKIYYGIAIASICIIPFIINILFFSRKRIKEQFT